jgi:mannose/fructose/N-acetylgalactosamine-specific phosphotransferase system component IIC
MSARQYIIGFLIFATLVIPLVQLSFGFHYVNYTSCPIENDIMILMAIGGVFEIIFFAAAFGFVLAVIPSKYKKEKKQTEAQKNAKGNNRASLILVGNSFHFFYLL